VFDDSDITFAAFAEEWWSRVAHTLAPSTKARWRGIIDNHLAPAFGGSLRSITPARVEAYLACRAAEGAAPWSCRHELKVLTHLLARAVKWEFLGRNPLADAQGRPLVATPKAPPGRTRFLTQDEIMRLLAACEGRSYLHAFVTVALNTGMRRNEVLSLSRSTVEFDNRLATLTKTKNGSSRVVFLNDAALAALRSLPATGDNFFSQTPYAIGAAFRRATKRAGVLRFRLHDLRHSFASHHAMAGTPLRALQELLGHKDGRMTARYSHLTDSYLRAAVDGLQLGTGHEGGTEKQP
jgi:integrase